MEQLRQSTNTSVLVGPFIDKNDGVTSLTGLVAADIASAAVVKGIGRTAMTLTDLGGINDFVHIADGYYSLEMTAANTDTTGNTRVTLRNDAVFIPVWNHFVVIPQQVYDSLVDGSDLLDVNASQIGGSTEAATLVVTNIGNLDGSVSLALSRLLAIMGGEGFSVSLHSLIAIVGLLNQLLADSDGGSGGTGGSGDQTLLSSGSLGRLVALIRRLTDEPGVLAKYSDGDLISLTGTAWTQLWSDLKLSVDNPVVVRHDIEVVAGTQQYALPPCVGEIVRLYKVESETGLVTFEMVPRSFYNPHGPGFTIEGNTLRITPKWTQGENMRLEYFPNGDVHPHEGIGASVEADTSAFVMAASPSGGVLDTRPNAYAGYLFRAFDVNGTQERVIASSTYPERMLSFTVPFDPPLSPGMMNYEVVPMFQKIGEHVLALLVARTILAANTNQKRYTMLTQEYREKVRGLRLMLTNLSTRRANRMGGDTVDNPSYLPNYLGVMAP